MKKIIMLATCLFFAAGASNIAAMITNITEQELQKAIVLSSTQKLETKQEFDKYITNIAQVFSQIPESQINTIETRQTIIEKIKNYVITAMPNYETNIKLKNQMLLLETEYKTLSNKNFGTAIVNVYDAMGQILVKNRADRHTLRKFAIVFTVVFVFVVVCLFGYHHVTHEKHSEQVEGTLPQERYIEINGGNNTMIGHIHNVLLRNDVFRILPTHVVKYNEGHFCNLGTIDHIDEESIREIGQENYIYLPDYTLERTLYSDNNRVPVGAIIVGTKNESVAKDFILESVIDLIREPKK